MSHGMTIPVYVLRVLPGNAEEKRDEAKEDVEDLKRQITALIAATPHWNSSDDSWSWVDAMGILSGDTAAMIDEILQVVMLSRGQ